MFLAFLLFLQVENPRTPVLKGLRAIDWVGSGLILGGALMVLLGLDFGNVTYPWSSPKVIALIIAGAVTIGLFVCNEWRFTRNPLMPLRLFKTASTSASFAVQSLNYFVFNGITYYLPLYSQSVLGVSALTAGVYMVPIILSTCLASVVAALLIQKTGKYRLLMYIAQALLVLGVGLLISFDLGNSIVQLFAYEVIIGLGTGLNDEAPTIAALAGNSERDAAATISFMSFLQSLATTVSIVVGGVIFQNQMQAAQGELRDSLGQAAASFSGDQATSNLELIDTLTASQQVVVRKAYFHAFKSDWIMVCSLQWSEGGADV